MVDDRVKSGINGFDELVDGGFHKGASILVAGGAGCGKTIFATQFLYKGASEYNEPGVYITLEEGPTNIWWNMKSFKWNITKLEEQDLMKIYRVGMFSPGDFANQFEHELGKIKDMVTEIDAKRLVIDSTTAFAMWMNSETDIRYNLFKLIDQTKNLGCTTLLTAETSGERDKFSKYGVEEFVVDGVIGLYFIPPMRAMLVKKMRGIKQDPRAHPFEITSDGFSINSKEQVLWESLNK